MIYPPKRDVWIVVLLMLISVTLFGAALLCVADYFWKREPGLWIPGLMLAAIGSLLLWIATGSAYEITTTDLRLRLGPLHWRLPLESIVEVYSTSRFGSDIGWGLAFSLDRLRIRCRNRWLPFWISPEDKPGFIAELQRANPHVKITQE